MLVIIYSNTLWLIYKEEDEYVAYAPLLGEKFRGDTFNWVSGLPFAEEEIQPDHMIRELLFDWGNDVVVAIREKKNKYKYLAGPDISHLREVS